MCSNDIMISSNEKNSLLLFIKFKRYKIMAMIQSGVRKPKYVVQIVINKNTDRLYAKSGDLLRLRPMEAIRKYIKGEIDSQTLAFNAYGLGLKTKEILNELALKFKIVSSKKAVEVLFTSFKSSKKEITLNVYLIETKNLSEKTKINDSNFDGDHIELSAKAWFDDVAVENKSVHHIFVDKKAKKMIVAIHPDEVSELKADKNMMLITNDGVTESDGIVHIVSSKGVNIRTMKDRIEKDIAEKNKTRIVGEFKRLSKKTISVSSFENGEWVKKAVLFTNIDTPKIEELSPGKYNIFIENTEKWLIIENVKSIMNNEKKALIISKGDFSEKTMDLEEINLIK